MNHRREEGLGGRYHWEGGDTMAGEGGQVENTKRGVIETRKLSRVDASCIAGCRAQDSQDAVI